jgi:hypothetical protein
VIDFITMDKAYLNYGYGVEVCGLAALRHFVEKNRIAGPCSEVVKEQKPSFNDLLKPRDDNPPVRFILSPIGMAPSHLTTTRLSEKRCLIRFGTIPSLSCLLLLRRPIPLSTLPSRTGGLNKGKAFQ